MATLPVSGRFTKEALINLQIQIVDLIMKFDERSVFKSTPNLIKLLTKSDKDNIPPAKEYLKKAITRVLTSSSTIW